MDNEQIKLTAMVLMHEHMLGELWAEHIKAKGGDAAALCESIAADNLDKIEGIYASRADEMSEGTHVLVQHIIHHAENFWKMVGSKVAPG